MRRSAAGIAMLATAASVFLLGGTGTAHAYPMGCESHLIPGGGSASCAYGTGAFRVKLTCDHGGLTHVRYGPWGAPGRDISEAYCPGWNDSRYTSVAT